MKIKTLTIWCLWLVVALFLYYPIFSADYVWDDTMLFVDNRRLVDEQLSWESVSIPILPGTSYLRPLVLFSWWLEFKIWGINSSISHIIGFISYFINVLLVYGLTYLLALRTEKKDSAFLMASLASLIYLLHPALIETTAWVSGRFDQFVTLFTLLSCLLFVYFSKYEKFPIIGSILISLSFLCALLSKELGIVLPFILLCLYFILTSQSKERYFTLCKQGIKKYKFLLIGIFVINILYFVLRANSLSGVYHAQLDMVYIQDVWFNNLKPLHAYSDYFKQSFLPFYTTAALHPIESYNFKSFLWVGLVCISSITLLWVIYCAYFKRSIAAWLAIAGFISIVLVLHIMPLTIVNNLIHERFMTQGLAFLAIAMVFIPYTTVLGKFHLSERVIKLAIGSVFVVWLGLSAITVKSIVPMWHSDYTLWYWLNKTYPNDEFARYNYWYSVSKYKSPTELLKLMDEYYKDKPLSTEDQILYAFAKLQLRDAESLEYYKGVIIALPKLHEPDPSKTYEKFTQNSLGITLTNYGAAYMGYAIANLHYKGDLDIVENNLRIAEYYFRPGEEYLVKVNRLIVLYLKEGNTNRVKDLYNEISNMSDSAKYKQHINNEIQSFCKNFYEKSVYCKEYEQHNLFK